MIPFFYDQDSNPIEKEKYTEEQCRWHDREADFYQWLNAVGQQRCDGSKAIPGFPTIQVFYIRKFSDYSANENIPPMLIVEDLTDVTHMLKMGDLLTDDQVILEIGINF
jgi:hypothetical protein